MVSTMVIGPGSVSLSLRVCGRARSALGRMHAPLEPQRAGDDRHHRLVAIGPDAHLDLVREIDAVDRLQKSMHEMLTRLLAFGHDVDARVLLQLQRQDGGIALGRRKLLAG